jgi:hypothetical protein
MIPGDILANNQPDSNTDCEQEHREFGEEEPDGINDKPEEDDDDEYMQELANMLHENMMEELANKEVQGGDAGDLE